MTNAILAASCLFAASAGLTNALDTRDAVVQPFGAQLSAATSTGHYTAHGVVDVSSIARQGEQSPSFFGDWYNRIHITPALLALGNVVSLQTRSIAVWNAWLDRPQTLATVTTQGADGVAIVPPVVPPAEFGPGQELTWTVSVGSDGPPVVDALITWTFQGLPPQSAEITGNRITGWTQVPDWGGDGVTETIGWLTDILTPLSGVEQRRQLRIAPRRTFDFDAMLTAQQRRYMEAALFDWSSRVWALPIWPDGSPLNSDVLQGSLSIASDTTNRDYVAGGLAMIIADAVTYEILEIDSVTAAGLALTHPTANAWPRGSARIYPVRTVRLASFPTLKRHTSNYSTVSPSFITVEPCDWAPNAGASAYRSFPVMERRPNTVEEPTTIFNRMIVVTDPGTGVADVDDTAGVGLPSHTHRFILDGGAFDRAAMRSLLYALAGRASSIWVPSWNDDLVLVDQVQNGAQTIDVEWSGYTRFLRGQIGRRDIRIELNDGTIRYRRLIGWTELDASTERLSLDVAMDIGFAPANVRAISFLTLSRLDSDNIKITHTQTIDGYAFVDLTWRADPRDV
ncbi:hypothetical protein [Dyella terrae]|uniref:hypothetical protein n=1 Tax=Dyella terrae TaxID=522259 RepID=UPI001EFC3117|nr:hypothetical protein [Dyella terrae]ULU26588.1 hypothetical protein DYST_03534 [Dyella terrae]